MTLPKWGTTARLECCRRRLIYTCLVMATSPLLKIFIGIILLCVVCIPEWFKATDGNVVYLFCIDACFEGFSYISTVVNKTLICLKQENSTKDVRETDTLQNNTVYTVNLSMYVNTSTLYFCEQQKYLHPLLQDLAIPENATNFPVELRGNYLIYSEEESHFTLMSIGDRDPSLPSSFKMHVKNTTKFNRTDNDGNGKSKGVKNHEVAINILLKFEHHIPYYKRTLGIIWLSLIPLVFMCGVLFVVCKVLQENKIVRTAFYKKASLQRRSYKQSRISPKKHCQEGTHQKCGGNKYRRTNSAPMLPVIAEHLDTTSSTPWPST
ncbi:transmembrane protein 156 [Pyxicephalus adspersus]|uniref:transmembrane protein 156 n=1 Tax=Pyxicephalus adspersus TaxID=30357 RepID=UPI003B5B9EA7